MELLKSFLNQNLHNLRDFPDFHEKVSMLESQNAVAPYDGYYQPLSLIISSAMATSREGLISHRQDSGLRGYS